jgi:hypothetical protein
VPRKVEGIAPIANDKTGYDSKDSKRQHEPYHLSKIIPPKAPLLKYSSILLKSLPHVKRPRENYHHDERELPVQPIHKNEFADARGKGEDDFGDEGFAGRAQLSKLYLICII